MTKGAVPAPLLEGCRVLDLTDEKGACCGRVLGDFGADVIVVEPPVGSTARQCGPFYKDQIEKEKSLFWFYTNANKRGITLNLESLEGREIFLRLLDSADVLVESGPPGRMDQLGLGYEELRRRKPSLVMTSITPFGQTGPYRDYAAEDLVLTALGGMVRLYGYLDTPPFRISAPQAYFLGSAHGAMASTIAFYHSELTGQGQFVDVSVQEAVVMALMVTTEIYELLRVNVRGAGPYFVSPRPAPEPPMLARQIWQVKDGYAMLLFGGGALAGGAASSKKIVELANADGYALGYADYDWINRDSSAATQEEVNAMMAAFEPWMMTKTKMELLTQAVKFGLTLAPANDLKDIAESPQLAVREYWTAVEHPELGETILYPGAPLKVSEGGWAIRRRAPLLGEHNREIYQGELGLSPARLAELQAAGVI